MAAALLSSIISFLFPAHRGQTDDNPLPLKAIPGLISVLDVALFRSVEGQLTATICSSHILLSCWLDVKHQAQLVLTLLREEDANNVHKALYESFARQCLETASDAIERLSTDRMAQAANLTDAYDSTSAVTSGGGHHHHHHHHNPTGVAISGVGVQGVTSGILESKEETGRRQPMQSPKDCWESPRLYCPDYVWADDVYSACQRWIRNLDKHPLMTKSSVDNNLALTSGNKPSKSGGGTTASASTAAVITSASSTNLMAETERETNILAHLVQDDIPVRLYQFRQAMEAEVVVTKRLYLVKSEYRVPFRSFLEAHQSLLRAPPMEVVDYYLNQSNNTSNGINDSDSEDLKAQLQSLLHQPELIEMLALEMEIEKLELALGEAIFPFSELSRTLDHKRAKLKVIPGVVDDEDLSTLQEFVRVR
jgi:hypothetical protein